MLKIRVTAIIMFFEVIFQFANDWSSPNGSQEYYFSANIPNGHIFVHTFRYIQDSIGCGAILNVMFTIY